MDQRGEHWPAYNDVLEGLMLPRRASPWTAPLDASAASPTGGRGHLSSRRGRLSRRIPSPDGTVVEVAL